VGVVIFWGGETGLIQLIASLQASVSTFSLLPIPLFILMGVILFESGMGTRAIFVLEKWFGRMPGRLSLLSVGAATLFSAMNGSTLATTAMLGSALVPEMEKAGYHKSMTMGPILGSGGLAMIIPPSDMAVVLAALAHVSIAGLLMAGIVPGLIIAAFYTAYIVGRCHFQRSVAPAYDVTPVPLSEKVITTAKYVLPFGLVIFGVIGVMLLGLATPSEAAATGALSSVFLVAVYRRLNWQVIKRTFLGVLDIAGMVFLIILTSVAFSQILAFSGATRGLIEFVTQLAVAPIILIMAMQVAVLILGCFMAAMPIMMICLPIFMPVVNTLGFDPIWFCLMFLINLEVGQETPPFGFLLFVMKGVAPPGTTMKEVYTAAIPFVIIDMAVIGLIFAFPGLVLKLG